MIVLCAGNPWKGIKLADQHLAEHLAKHVRVLYVDPPRSRLSRLIDSTRAVDARRGPVLLSPQLAHLSPVVTPGMSRAGFGVLASADLRRLLRRTALRLPPVRALISAWPLHPVFGSCDENLSVFWAQDDFAAAAGEWGLSATRIRRHEAARVRAADLVVAASTIVQDRWLPISRATELIPFGCDTTTYASWHTIEPADDVRIAEPIAVVVGQINFRVDLALLESVVDAGVSLLLVGPIDHPEIERMARLLARPMVQAVGSQPADAVPRYLRRAAVGLVPYNECAFNRSSFPLKTLEYLAARLPVVATGLPATRWLNSPLIRIADGPRDFAAATRHALKGTAVERLREERWQFVQPHSYERRAMAFVAAIDERIDRMARSGRPRRTA